MANISNKTLYKHFEGKPAIVKALLYDDFIASVITIREVLPVDNIKSATILMLEKTQMSIYENRTIYKNLIKYYGQESLKRDITEQLSNLNNKLYTQYDFPDDEREFVAFFLASSQASILIWWLCEHDDIPPKRIARLFSTWAFAHWREIETQNEKYR